MNNLNATSKDQYMFEQPDMDEEEEFENEYICKKGFYLII